MRLKNFIKGNWKFFIKYSIVGATGTVLDVGGFGMLIAYTALGENLITRGFAASISFTAAVINNFTWNRLWTFRDRRSHIKTLFLKFLIVSIGGLILNVILLTGFSIVFASLLGIPSDNLPVIFSIAAKLSAAALVLFYNFLMNRYWTFSPGAVDQEAGIREQGTGSKDQNN